MKVDQLAYKKELEEELEQILNYWLQHSIDHFHGGFYGKIDNENLVTANAEKGSVLNSRILWAFSAGFNYLKKKEYLEVAKRAYQYIKTYFVDHEFGGIYWSVDYKGNKLKDRKQIYGIAFCIYGLSEYYKATGETAVLQLAVNLFRTIEKYSFDEKLHGYYEAFTRNWKPLEDLRLSEKDNNEMKTMNTHLHIIEAYANLYEIWPDDQLKKQIENLLAVFDDHFIHKGTGHLILFFDEQWHPKSTLISYGHDIEASWLLQQCAEKIRHKEWTETMKERALFIAHAAAKGLDMDGGLWYEFEPTTGTFIKEKHSWPQAEAMIGFINAYEHSGADQYAQRSYNSWTFIKKYIKDTRYGEWFWGIGEDHRIMPGQDKAGFWKCPYHNTRACLELIKRLPVSF